MKFFKPDEYLPEVENIYFELNRELTQHLPFARIDHIGSSAIHGAISKGDLDVLVAVPKEKFAESLAKIKSLGFAVKEGTHRSDSLCMLTTNKYKKDVAVQLIEKGSENEMFVTFRDQMNANPGLVTSYNFMKKSCEGLSPDEYRLRKSRFIESTLQPQVWFKKKKYGWGWTPATLEGWIVVVMYMAAVMAYPLWADFSGQIFSIPTFLIINLILTATLIGICIKRGEKPSWSWGDGQ